MSKRKQNGKSRPVTCACVAAPQLILACSGGSDAGELADRAARMLAKSGPGRMFCLAGIGGRVSGVVEDMKKAEKILVIDGCAADCAGNTLRQAGFQGFDHLRLCEMGVAAGQPVVCNVNLQKVVEKGRALLEGWSSGDDSQNEHV